MHYDYVIVGGGPGRRLRHRRHPRARPRAAASCCSRARTIRRTTARRSPRTCGSARRPRTSSRSTTTPSTASSKVELALRREVVELDPTARQIWDDRGATYEYGELLLATGGRPRRLDVEGAELEGIHYFRYLEDYLYFERHLDALPARAGGGRRLHRHGDGRGAPPRRQGSDAGLPRGVPAAARAAARPRPVRRRLLPRARASRPCPASSVDALRGARRRDRRATAQRQRGRRRRSSLVGVGIEPAHRAGRGRRARGRQRHRGRRVRAHAPTRTSTPPATSPSSRTWRSASACGSSTGTTPAQHGSAVGANMAGANRPYTTCRSSTPTSSTSAGRRSASVDATLDTARRVEARSSARASSSTCSDDVDPRRAAVERLGEARLGPPSDPQAKPMSGAEREAAVAEFAAQ